MLNEAAARKTRQMIKQFTGLRVESVAFIQRGCNLEFAAIIVHSDRERTAAEEFLTDPRCPFVVTRETATRIFIAGVES